MFANEAVAEPVIVGLGAGKLKAEWGNGAIGEVSGLDMLAGWRCGRFLGLPHAKPRLCLYSVGLLPPRDILIRFSLYQCR